MTCQHRPMARQRTPANGSFRQPSAIAVLQGAVTRPQDEQSRHRRRRAAACSSSATPDFARTLGTDHLGCAATSARQSCKYDAIIIQSFQRCNSSGMGMGSVFVSSRQGSLRLPPCRQLPNGAAGSLPAAAVVFDELGCYQWSNETRVTRSARHNVSHPKQESLHLTAKHCMLLAGPALTIMIYRDICVPLLAADAKLLVARHNQVLEQTCHTFVMPSLSWLHSALCFQIIQAFSRIVAAGSMWSSAFLLLDEAANTLQSGLHPTESHALVSIARTTQTALESTFTASDTWCEQLIYLRCCIMPEKLFPASCSKHLDQLQGVGGLTHPQQCLLVKCLLLAGLHQASEAGMLLHTTSLQYKQHHHHALCKGCQQTSVTAALFMHGEQS